MTTDQERPVWPFQRADPLLPAPKFAELRASCPVTQVQMWDGSCAWLATRYDDFKSLLRNPDMSAQTSRPGYPNSSANHQASRGNQVSFIRKDGREHALQRKMLTKAFSAHQVAALRPFIEGLVGDLLDDMARRTPPVNLQAALADPVPSHVICEILDLPRQDESFLSDRVNAWMNLDSTPNVSAKASADLLGYLGRLVDDRSGSAGDDLVSRLTRIQRESTEFSRADLIQMIHLLIIGGFDTTANMITLGTVLLLRHPAQLTELRTCPELMPAAVEEMLRYLSVAHHVASRVALNDVAIRGVTIPAGAGVIAAIPAANHDPEAFPDPSRFDIHRDARDHVAFNFGVHQCLGQHLARLELEIVFTSLFRRFPTLRLAVGESALEFRNSMIYGVRELPVTW